MHKFVELPKNVKIRCGFELLEIRDHQMVDPDIPFFSFLLERCNYTSFENLARAMNQANISFTMIVETCVHELETQRDVWLDGMVERYGIYHKHWYTLVKIAKTDKGRRYVAEFAGKIKSCRNLKELYKTLQTTSEFGMDLTRRVRGDIKCITG